MIVHCPFCRRGCDVADGATTASCVTGHRFDVGVAAAVPGRYFVARSPGRDFVQTATPDEIRASLAARRFRVYDYATESDGRNFEEFQRDGGGRWRMLAELLAEWGEPCPTPAPKPRSAPRYVTPCAALGGAAGCLAIACFGQALMHAAAWLFWCFGSTWGWVAFGTSKDSVLLDLIVVTVVTVFGAIRGVAHSGSPAFQKTWSETFWGAAGMASDDLTNLRGPHRSFEHGAEIVGTLFIAIILALPVILILLALWLR